jgi:hypothetical protein
MKPMQFRKVRFAAWKGVTRCMKQFVDPARVKFTSAPNRSKRMSE